MNKSQLIYLGHLITSEGLKADPKKEEASKMQIRLIEPPWDDQLPI